MTDLASLGAFLDDVDTDVWKIMSSDFSVEVTDTYRVPSLDDPALTYDDPDEQTKKAKRIETCVLYVDIRDSSSISAERRPQTLARMYSAFVRAMIRCARRGGGHVRNIVGDRVMVVFDAFDCYEQAIRTAALCNTAAQRIINRRIGSFEFRCGIGIDYGTMLVVKAGVPRRGGEKEFYRSLVWLGRPANVASKLTDMAHKRVRRSEPAVNVGYYYPSIDKWSWVQQPVATFLGRLTPTYSGPVLQHSEEYFLSFHRTTLYHPTVTYPPVLITEDVLEGLRIHLGADDPACQGWKKQALTVAGFDGTVYGADPLLDFP
jgi:class 3 adenylate cyclase